MSKPIINTNKTIIAISAIAILYFLFTLKSNSSEKIVIQPASQEDISASKSNNYSTPNNTTAGKNSFPSDIISNSAPNIIDIPDNNNAGFDPTSVGININNIPDDLPEDLREQILNPPDLPDDLKAQLEAASAELPPDIIESLNTPPREVTIDEVNRIPGVKFNTEGSALN